MLERKKILFIRFSSIGDIVVTTPVLRLVKKQLGAEVHYLTKHQFSHLIQGNPYVDKLHVIRHSVNEIIDDLRRENFTDIIDLHNNLRSHELTFKLWRKATRVNKLTLRRRLYARFKINLLPHTHMVYRNIRTVTHLGVVDDGGGMDYVIKTTELSQDSEYFISESDKLLGLVLGAAHYTKTMPESLLHELVKLWDGNIALIGGPQEASVGNRIAQKYEKKVVNFAGKLSIDESVYVINRSDVLITGDTGMMHLGAAMQCPLVLVWGATDEVFGMTPYYGKNQPAKWSESKVPDLHCRPCTRMGSASCPKGHFNCMNLQSASSIISKAEDLIVEYVAK